ncbi:phosphatidate cytidylyltransferase [Ruminococcus sp. YRD2003]|uniref:phosphatidate cytidylyltransferase n=1 Tax=Ruminococcus sp. YRD2003 TaxID=1452313 RepID=UPI0008CF16CB|nr:phosphatidate cytidylyltransferase [Ruminococcus flavefaciens]
MLTRIISGAVGAALLAVILYFHDTILLPIAVAAMVAVMLFELIRAVKLEKCLPVLIPAELCGIALPLLYGTLSHDGTTELFHIITFTVTLAAAFIIFITWLAKHKYIRYEQVFFVLACMVLVPQAMTTMIRIERTDSKNGLFLLIMALCGAWIADTGAYFTGVAIGKHKLCPEISPKKTIEGFIGGILTTAITYAAAFSIYYGFTPKRAVISLVMGAFCAVVGAIGDLSASMVKRQIGFKDYGKIMPGHGGLMDRFDSVLFVLPTFYVFIAFFGIHMYL